MCTSVVCGPAESGPTGGAGLLGVAWQVSVVGRVQKGTGAPHGASEPASATAGQAAKCQSHRRQLEPPLEPPQATLLR
jgi:hypothetical protein